MRSVSYRLADLNRVTVPLGFRGENEHTRVIIDCKKAFDEYPDAIPSLAVSPPNGTAYPAVIVREGDLVYWNIRDSDLAKEGRGTAQLTFTEDGVVRKDDIFNTVIGKSILPAGPAPDPIADWITEANKALEDVEHAIEAAVHAPVIDDNGYWAVWDSDAEEYVETEYKAQGADGHDGVGIVSIEKTGTSGLVDTYTITFTSGNPVTYTVTNGKPGDPGQDATPALITVDYSDLTYPVAAGTMCSHNGLLYKANQAITTIEAWNAAHWTQTTIEAEQDALKNRIAKKPDSISPEETESDLYICDEDGNVIAKFKDGHIITKNFNSEEIDPDIIKEAIQNTADLFICDANGNVIAEFANGHIKTKYFDSSSSATGGILNRVKAQTDGVYATCRWHQPNSSSKQFCMLLGGDSHYDPQRVANMVEFLNSIDAFDAGIMLGDLSGNTFSDSVGFYKNAIANAQKPFITVLGNHDVVGATSDSDLWDKYGDCFQYAQLASGEAVNGKCYYYKDFASYKIRIIVLMQYDYTYTGDLCFGQDQIDWLVNTLNSTPSDYGVIIAEHTNSSRYMTYEMDSSVTSSTWLRSNYAPTVMDGDPVPDIVNAWINGTTLSQTYSYTFQNPPEALSVSADFTERGNGEFITYIGGHWHMNVLGTPTAFTDQPDYHVPAAGLPAATQGDMPRKEGTVSEDSLNVLAVDRDKKTVKIFQIGAHFTKDAVDRQYFKYNYGEE